MDAQEMEAAIEELRANINSDVQALMGKLDSHYLRMRNRLQRSADEKTKALERTEAELNRRARDLEQREAELQQKMSKATANGHDDKAGANQCDAKANGPAAPVATSSLFGGAKASTPAAAPKATSLFGGAKAVAATSQKDSADEPHTSSTKSSLFAGTAKAVTADAPKTSSLFGDSVQQKQQQAKPAKASSLFGGPSQDKPVDKNAAVAEAAEVSKPTAGSSLFGGYKPAAVARKQSEDSDQATPTPAASVQQGAPSSPSGVDRSAPGSASQLRAQFERRSSNSDIPSAGKNLLGSRQRAKSEGRLPKRVQFEDDDTPSVAATSSSAAPAAPAKAAPASLFGAAAKATAPVSLFGEAKKDAPASLFEEDDDAPCVPATSSSAAPAALAKAAPASLFGAGAKAAPASLFGRPEKAAPSRSLFGGAPATASNGTANTYKESAHDAAGKEAGHIDCSDPGSASTLRSQFERKLSNGAEEDGGRRKSWAPKTATVQLPNGEGTTRVQVGGQVGNVYTAKTVFGQPPPKKKTFADLP